MPLGEDFKMKVGELFGTCQQLIFIMATGIVVRTLAGFLKHKAQDPAIIVLDEKGEYAISLLSGHLGGANVLARRVAEYFGGKAVITTATDVNGLVAVDMLAKQMGCMLTDYPAATLLTAMMLEGRRMGVKLEAEASSMVEDGTMVQGGIPGEPSQAECRRLIREKLSELGQKRCKPLVEAFQAKGQRLSWIESAEAEAQVDGVIRIGWNGVMGDKIHMDGNPDRNAGNRPMIRITPRILSLGIGCRRGKSYEELMGFVRKNLNSLGLPVEAVCNIGTTQLKADEAGLLKLGAELKADILFYENEAIEEVQDRFEASAFVEKTVGVKNVSASCGYLASGRGQCLLPVRKENGMTLSVYLREEEAGAAVPMPLTLMIAGTHSGVGKTTATMGLLAVLTESRTVQAYKVGPDYLDPTYHTHITGRPSRNLDNVLMSDEAVRSIFQSTYVACPEKGINIIEAAMGLFDGSISEPERGSGASIAKLLNCPVLLVVDGTGISHSLAALIKGYQHYDPRVRFAGILINRVSSKQHYDLLRTIVEHKTGLKCWGYLPKSLPALPSRHLGLLPSSELADLEERVRSLADGIKGTVDIEGLVRHLESSGDEASSSAEVFVRHEESDRLRIAVARDSAFNFYYEDNLQLLRDMGAEILFFSPMADAALPESIDALYLGGGYPEVYAGELSSNLSMRSAIKAALEAGLPYFAECGGFMYLCSSLTTLDETQYDMVGWYEGRAYMTKRLNRFGYKTLTLMQDCILGRAGTSIRVHEFHHSDVEGMEEAPVFRLEKKRADGTQIEEACGYRKGNGIAGYPHFHFHGNREMAEALIKAAKIFREERRGKACG